MPRIEARSQQSFWKTTPFLALPVATQIFLQSMLGMADITMVGQLGETAIAAVGLATKLHFLLFMAMIGLATACSVLIAQHIDAESLDSFEILRSIILLKTMTKLLFFSPPPPHEENVILWFCVYF